MRRPAAGAAIVLLGCGLAACESTQDRSARLSREAEGAGLGGKGLEVTRRSKDVKVGRTTVLTDANGSAAVVELRNVSERAFARVPVALDVVGRGGESVYRNDAGGLEESLVGASVVRPGQRLLWVNDQVTASGRPRRVKARVGAQARPVRGRVPRMVVSETRLAGDPTSGVAVEGKVENTSRILQRKLVIYVVARRGRRIVAAGRAQVPRLAAGRRAGFSAFFIGDPRGARLTLAAPPTNLR